MRHAGEYILRKRPAQTLARKLRALGFAAEALPPEGDDGPEWYVVCPLAGYENPKSIYELRAEIAQVCPRNHTCAFPNAPGGPEVVVS